MIDTPRAALPRWLIDDTADIGQARVFVVHTARPRFVGELFPGDETPLAGVTIAAPHGESVGAIHWIDEPIFDADELCRSLAAAIINHYAIRDRA